MKTVTAIGFLDEVELGGSTRPWAVIVADEDEETFPCVVKLFKEKTLQQQHAIAKEAFGIELAHYFDLPAPEWYLVNFSEDFQATLSEEQREGLRTKAKGWKFGTRLLEGYSILQADNLSRPKIKEYDLGSVYAFDNLVFNLDRGGFRNKPNILIRDEDYALIDHEQILTFIDDPDQPNHRIVDEFPTFHLRYQYDKHIFYPVLKGLRSATRSSVFDTFAEYLRSLPEHMLDNAADFLAKHGLSTGNYDLLRYYLRKAKQDSTAFVNVLEQQLQ